MNGEEDHPVLGSRIGDAVRHIRTSARNLNQNQFDPSNSRVMHGVATVLDAHQKAQAFRHAGMGSAIRYTLGMPQLSPGMGDLYRSQILKRYGGSQPGRNPSPLYPSHERGDVDGEEASGYDR